MKLATFAARRIPNITLRPRVILPMLVGFFLVCWAGFMVGSVRGPDNLGFVMLRGSGDEPGLRVQLDVGTLAPMGVTNSMYLYRDGIWRIPLSPKRPIKAIVVSHAMGDKPNTASWQISVSPTSDPNWLPASTAWEAPRLVLTLDPSLTPGSLWPSRKPVFNWLGDAPIMGSDARRALAVTLLAGLGLLSTRWLWRAAAVTEPAASGR
jgi:hypothetical protein